MKQKIKVLVVDDSALIRKILTEGLSKDPYIEVVGDASDPYVARDMIIKHRPHVLTLDVEMPRMDGVDFLRRLMPQYPLPVVMVSSLTQRGKEVTLDALEAGAVDFVSKPTSNIVDGLNSMITELITKIKLASTANVSHFKDRRKESFKHITSKITGSLTETEHKVIAIGASTGGTAAIREVVDSLPVLSPGIVIVQHMPAGFTKIFAERLDQSAKVKVFEAQSGDKIIPGSVLVAPGGYHMTVNRVGDEYRVVCAEGEKINGHCPSVSTLFHSVAKNVGKNALGIMLTGMGRDGADGMLEMRENGAYNIAQDEESSVIFGMPKVAIEKGAVHEVLSLSNISKKIMNYFER